MCTRVEGPFNRCTIWFQGCNINCKGCGNKSLQSFTPNHIVSLDKLVSIVKEAKEKYNIEGVTLSGGEPSLQKGLIEFNKTIRNQGLGIILFSGRYKASLPQELVNSVDLLIDGPFEQKHLDHKRILLGSTNKRLSFITNRYKKTKSYFFNDISTEEVVIDNYIFVNGD